MALLCDLRHNIQAWHKMGESYSAIGERYSITKAMAWQIAHGYKPGKRVSALLHLEPDCDLKYTRTRRSRLNEIAQAAGYNNWSNYESAVLHRGKLNEGE